jgi:glycosyltransferase involved in cell wall biosynthesis
VEAIGLLPPELREKVTLSIAHNGPLKLGRYAEEIQSHIVRLGLSGRVIFLGIKRHDEMPQVYRQHDLVIFASTLAEGLPMVMMEAMCAGCAVITTGSGGAIELADPADLPIFPKEHPLALSRLLAKLLRNRKLLFDIARRGQEVVSREFTFKRMARKFSDTLHLVLQGKSDRRSCQLEVAKP